MAAKKDHTCSVCLELFSDPKILPCCHTFCLKCLEKTERSTEKEREIACPQCRKTHKIPSGGLGELLTDFIASYELEVTSLKSSQSRSAKKAITCGECERADPVVSYCSDCQNYLCQVCSEQLHKMLKAYRGHKVIQIQELDATALQSSQVKYCAKHKKEPVKLYCETCNEPICRDCTVVEHRDHSYNFAHDARKKIDNELVSLRENVEHKVAVFKGNLGEIKKVETAAASYSQVVNADINTFFDQLIQSIEARRKYLLTQAEAEYQKDLKLIWADKVFHETILSQIAAVFGLTEKARKCTGDVEMILTALQSISQLSHLKEIEWDASAFSGVASSPAKFIKGQKILLDKTGGLERKSAVSGVLKVLNQPQAANLGSSVSFSVKYVNPSSQILRDERSGMPVSLKNTQETDLKVVVIYGKSQKELDSANISLKSVSSGKSRSPVPLQKQGNSSTEAKQKPNREDEMFETVPKAKYKPSVGSDGTYTISIRLVCGGNHTVTFKVGKQEDKKFSFFVSGQPQHGARVRKGPDWQPPRKAAASTSAYTTGYHGPTTLQHAMGTTPNTHDELGTVDIYAGQGYYQSRYSAPSTNPSTVCVSDSRLGYHSYYQWGQGGVYEIELV